MTEQLGMEFSETSFDYGKAAAPEPRTHRASFLAGILSEWTLGAAKPTEADRKWFIDVAREALDKANVRRRSQ